MFDLPPRLESCTLPLLPALQGEVQGEEGGGGLRISLSEKGERIPNHLDNHQTKLRQSQPSHQNQLSGNQLRQRKRSGSFCCTSHPAPRDCLKDTAAAGCITVPWSGPICGNSWSRRRGAAPDRTAFRAEKIEEEGIPRQVGTSAGVCNNED